MVSPRKEPKLPVRQLTILAICRFAEPVALTSVYPYLPEMIESFGIPKDNVARWAGLASASFSMCQCLTAILWGQMSDRFGRKYLILTSLTCTMISSIIFGLSGSIPAMITARAIGGASSGTVGIIRTMVAEMVTEKELQPRAFSVMPLVWTIGSILGPSFGGALANPAEKYGGIFKQSWLLEKFPFLLPNLISSILFLFGLTVGVLFLKETLESKKYRKDYGLILGKYLTSFCRKPRHKSLQDDDEGEPFLANAGQKKSKPFHRPSYREVFSPQSNVNLIAYTLLAMHSQACDQLLPIFMHYPEQDPNSEDISLPLKFAGGFGISSGRIGVLFTMYGIAGCCIQFLAFPPIAKKYGILRCLKFVSVTFPFVYFFIPFTSLMPTAIGKQAAIFMLMFVKCWLGIFAFPCTTILLTNSASSLAILGTLNGIATSTSAIGRASGPFLAGHTFTVGVDMGYIITPWWLLSFIAIIAAIPVFFLREMDGFSANDDSDDEEEESSIPPYEDEANENAIEEVDAPLNKAQSRSHQDGRINALERRMSSPIGIGDIGPPNARRFSNNLGATRAGFGSGSDVGTSS